MPGKVTYKNLFTLVDDLINSKIRYDTSSRYSDQTTNRGLVAPTALSTASGARQAEAFELVSAVQTILEEALESRIISGLNVTQTEPISDAVTVSAGSGTTGANVYTLASAINVTIPFDNTNRIFYIHLKNDAIIIDTSEYDDKVTLAKIVIPVPGITNRVINQSDDSTDAYIVQFQKYNLYGDASGKFEEDTVELLKDNIGDIIADTIIGNLRLSENLKITNTAGTLELNSDSLQLKDSSGNLLSKFNDKGTFYYDTHGVELAKFAVDGAKIGNMLLTTNTIQSANFISGYNGKGFQIKDDGDAQFWNVQVRGELHSAVFTKDEVQVSGGDLLVTNGTILNEDINNSTTNFQIKEAVFAVNDILQLKNENQSEFMRVSATGTEGDIPTITVVRSYQGGPAAPAKSWVKGDVIAEMSSRVSIVTSGDSAANVPYIDVIERTSGDAPNCEITKMRMGNLCGITDSDMGGQLSGYGMYADNVYLKGCLFAPNISTATSGSRIEMNSECFYAYNATVPVFKLCYGVVNPGDVVIGDEATDFMKWDNSASCLRFESFGTSRCVEIGDGLILANELCLVDANCDCCYSYLSSGQWFFHDTLGNNVPYVRRVCTDSAATGATVCLCGWTASPSVLVAIKELGSYDSGFSASCQNWCVWSTTPVSYSNSALDFGYCFDVHACLVKTSGTFPECIQDVAFGTCVVTNTSVNCTTVRGQFQLWKTDAVAANCYCYGTICWRVCYKCNAGGCAWCSCEWSFEQAHSTEGELKTNQNDCHIIIYAGGAGCYILCAEAVGATAWTCSLLPQGMNCCCCRAMTPTSTLSTTCNQSDSYSFPDGPMVCCGFSHEESCTAGGAFAGSTPSDVYCSYICYTWGGTGCYCMDLIQGSTWNCTRAQIDAKVCIFGCALCACTLFNVTRIQGGSCTASATASQTAYCKDMSACNVCTFSELCLCLHRYQDTCACGGDSQAIINNCTCGSGWSISAGYIVQCWCSFVDSVTCEYTRLYGTKDTIDAQTVLDPSGVISYLAVAAS